MENSPQQIAAARQTIKQLLIVLDKADRKFRSARNWGFLDILGGGLLTDLMKHGKLSSASADMNEVQRLLGYLQAQLGNVSFPNDYRMQLGGFSTFADFLFDGAIFDIYMQSKIMRSIDELQRLYGKLEQLDGVLAKM